MLKTCALILLTAVTANSFAAGCAKPRNAFDNVYCAGNLFAQLDKEFNEKYTSLRKQLNAAQQQSLKQGQLKWIKERDAACSETRADGYLVNLDCAVDMTQSRLDFLKERERECTSTGCVDSKLAE
jgi:uncharacterized protein YecT (DUF1311 family)